MRDILWGVLIAAVCLFFLSISIRLSRLESAVIDQAGVLSVHIECIQTNQEALGALFGQVAK